MGDCPPSTWRGLLSSPAFWPLRLWEGHQRGPQRKVKVSAVPRRRLGTFSTNSSARATLANLQGITVLTVASTKTRRTPTGLPSALLTAICLLSAWTTSTGATRENVDPSSGKHALRIAPARASLQSTWSGPRAVWQMLGLVNSVLKDMTGSEQHPCPTMLQMRLNVKARG